MDLAVTMKHMLCGIILEHCMPEAISGVTPLFLAAAGSIGFGSYVQTSYSVCSLTSNASCASQNFIMT